MRAHPRSLLFEWGWRLFFSRTRQVFSQFGKTISPLPNQQGRTAPSKFLALVPGFSPLPISSSPAAGDGTQRINQRYPRTAFLRAIASNVTLAPAVNFPPGFSLRSTGGSTRESLQFLRGNPTALTRGRASCVCPRFVSVGKANVRGRLSGIACTWAASQYCGSTID